MLPSKCTAGLWAQKEKRKLSGTCKARRKVCPKLHSNCPQLAGASSHLPSGLSVWGITLSTAHVFSCNTQNKPSRLTATWSSFYKDTETQGVNLLKYKCNIELKSSPNRCVLSLCSSCILHVPVRAIHTLCSVLFQYTLLAVSHLKGKLLEGRDSVLWTSYCLAQSLTTINFHPSKHVSFSKYLLNLLWICCSIPMIHTW